MKIPFQQFEQYIDETILKRGLSYFKKGYVNEPVEITSGSYETIVRGTENYSVRLILKNGDITNYTCDCPYDFGPVCKHVAAVIFYLHHGKPEPQQKTKPEKRTKNTSNRKTVAQQVVELLDRVSHNDLKDFVRAQSETDASFRRVLLSAFAYLSENESKTFYTSQIKSILRSAKGRYSFIDWHNARFVGRAVGELLTTAQKHFENGNYESCFFITSAVLEEMTKALQFADDSNADIGSNIYEAYNMLAEIASAELSEQFRKQLFDYTITAYKKNIFSGWDWHLGMLKIASIIITNQSETKKIMTLLDQVEKGDYLYEFEQAQTIKLEVLKKTSGEKEVKSFIMQNLSNPSLRAEAIRNALSNNDYIKAKTIASDGIKHDAKEKPGLIMVWYDWLLNIALEQKETDKIIEYARLLFIDSKQEQQKYYETLKSHVKMEHWDAFVERLVHDIQTKNRFYDFNLIASIHINEGSSEKLMQFIKHEFARGAISMEGVKHYEKHLKGYEFDLADLYEQGITKHIQNYTGRNHYKNACRYIRRMEKLGAKEKAGQLIEKLKTMYPQRSALIEELDNLNIRY